MKTENRPASGGFGTVSTFSGYGTVVTSNAAQQAESATPARQQRLSPGQRTASCATYFDIASTILGSVTGDLDDLLLNAVKDGDYKKIEQMLVQRSDIIVDIDCKDKHTGNTSLIWAAKKGHNKILQLLLRHGADPTLQNYEAHTALEVAMGVTKTLLFDSVSRGLESSHRLLLQAAWQGNIEVIRRLLTTSKALDINCQNAEGLTPLMLVARDVQLFERLCSQLKKPYNPVEVAKELMTARVDIHARDLDGRSCLHYAAQSKASASKQLVQTFIEGGSEPAQLDKRQYTPIHWASQSGNTDVVVALLNGGSEVNSRGFAGLTPLHVSAHNDHHHTAVTLLQHGADVTLIDDRGLTPVDLAKTRKMKTTLKEAWTEATQNNGPRELGPILISQNRETSSRISSMKDESPGWKKGEVIFDDMAVSNFAAQRNSQTTRQGAARTTLSTAERGHRAERTLFEEIEGGRYTPSLMQSRENTRLLGTIRNKPRPSVLPNIVRSSSVSSGTGIKSPESSPTGRSNSQGNELRRSLEDGRNILAQKSNSKRAQLPVTGSLGKTTPLATSEMTEHREDSSSNNNYSVHRRSGSDPFATRITDIASTLESIISHRRHSRSTVEPFTLSQLRTPLERETNTCINIPRTIPEDNSFTSSSSVITLEAGNTNAEHSSQAVEMVSLPPNTSQMLAPTTIFHVHQPFLKFEDKLSKVASKDNDSSSSKEPSPRSDDDIPDTKISFGILNPLGLFRSPSLLKEEFVLAESRPRDLFLASSGSDPASSSSSLSTSSSSPRDGDVTLMHTAYRARAIKRTGFQNIDLMQKLKKSAETVDGNNSPKNSSPLLSVSEDKRAPVYRNCKLTEMDRMKKSQGTLSQQQNRTVDTTRPAVLKGNNISASESDGKKPASHLLDANSQQKGSGHGAPFSGKGRLVILRDSFSEFDEVFVSESPKPSQNPHALFSEGVDLKDTSLGYAESNFRSSEQLGIASVHSESPRMSVSDVTISSILQSELNVQLNASSCRQTQSECKKTLASQCCPEQVKNNACSGGTSSIINTGNLSSFASVLADSSPGITQTASNSHQLIDCKSLTCSDTTNNAVPKAMTTFGHKPACCKSSTSLSSCKPMSTITNTSASKPVSSKPASVTSNAAIFKSTVSKPSSVVPCSGNVPTTTNISETKRTASSAVITLSTTSRNTIAPSQKSCEHLPKPQKSASAESLASQGSSGSSVPTKQTAADSGRKQSILSGSSKSSATTTAKNVITRLTRSEPVISKGNSTSAIGSSENSICGKKSCHVGGKLTPNSAAKSMSKAVHSSARQQHIQTAATRHPLVPATATSTSSSKPASAVSFSSISKVMKRLTKSMASPRPSQVRSQQELLPSTANVQSVLDAPSSTSATSVQKVDVANGTLVTKNVQSNVKPVIAINSESSTDKIEKYQHAHIPKPEEMPKTNNLSQNTVSSIFEGSDFTAFSHTEQKPTTETKSDQTSNTVISGKSAAIVKSSSDSVLSKKLNVQDDKDPLAGGKQPLVKITFSGMKARSSSLGFKRCEPGIVVNTPVIVNPFENLVTYQNPREEECGLDVTVSNFSNNLVCRPDSSAAGKGKVTAAAGKCRQSKVQKKGKDSKRPMSSTSRQTSAGRRKGSRGREATGSEDAHHKSSKRIWSGKKQGKKSVDKQEDKGRQEEKEAEELLSKMTADGNIAVISGIGWHLTTPCVDTSDIGVASQMHLDSSEPDISDVESIEDAETLVKQLDVNRGNIPINSPRFQEIKIQKEKLDVMKQIPVMTHDGFPPMNLDVTHKDSLSFRCIVTEEDLNHTNPANFEGVSHDLHKEPLVGNLTPIPEMPSASLSKGSLAEVQRGCSLKYSKLERLLDGNGVSPVFQNLKSPVAVEESEKQASAGNRISDNNTIQPCIEVTSVAESSKQSRHATRRTQSLREGNASERRNKPKRERKFSESKKDNDEEINDAIEEILSATNSSMTSTLRSTLKSDCNPLSKEQSQPLHRLKAHSKESPFHAARKSQDDDDGDASTLDESCSDPEEGTNPNLLKVMHLEHFDLGAKVKAMIDAGADKSKIKAMIQADEEAQQQEAKHIIKVMNSFRHMQLHVNGSSNSREPPARSESQRVSKVADRVPLVRPSSAGTLRAKGRFHEVKKTTSCGNAQKVVGSKEMHGDDAMYFGVRVHEDKSAMAAAATILEQEVVRDALADTAGSETMYSRLNRGGSHAGSTCTSDSQEDETIQWKKGNVLGKGAFGTVWCGLTNEGELIAVKQIELTTSDLCKAEREYEKVQEEVELLKTLNHINIVGYLGTSFEDGLVSIFMQFVPGGSIASILARFGALDEAVFRRYTRQILQGVEYLHDNDVIHRDIKGGNVMLMPNGIIKLIDFGCAKRLCINLSLSHSQILRSMKGTPYWMAPEVVNESGHGKKSDIWSIGCTVFEMATMKPPWAEMNPMAAIFAIGSDRPVPNLPDKFSPEAIAFVSKCLTRNQHKRSSATELLKDVFMMERPSKR